MKQPPPVIIDYAFDNEGRRTPPEEPERQKAIENYNLATFGQRRPISPRYVLLSVFAAAAIVLAMTPFVPRWADYLLFILGAVIAAYLDRRR